MAENIDKSKDSAMFDKDLVGNQKVKVNPEGHRQQLLKLRTWWGYARSIHAEARLEALRDHDFYDGDQWLPEDAEEVRARGQIPQVFNRIKSTIDWILGTQKRSRVDFRVLPRTSEDAKGAEVKTQILKYISDVNKVQEERSQAFGDAVKSGLGWVEAGIRNEPGEEPIFVDYEDWRNLWVDPLSVRRDIKDARFIFRRKRVDLDVACAMFPEFAGALSMYARGSSSYDDDSDLDYIDSDTDLEAQIEDKSYSGSEVDIRSRVDLMECWYKTPCKVKLFQHGLEDIGTLYGQRYRESDEIHQALVAEGYATTVDALRMIVRCTIYAGDIVLRDMDSPYNHNRFPFIPVWGFKKKRDNTPYGVVRNLRDPQDDLNKRRSKALFILATNQVIADDDAVEDWDDLMDEVTRPDGLIKKKPNSEITLNTDRDLAAQHVDLMSQDAEYIESTGGVTDEQMGRQTNAMSGKAIEKRQDQGQMTTSEVFDNLRVSVQALGEILLSLVEQYYTDQKIIRITNEKGQPEFVEINGQHPDTGEMLNDITASQADFIVDSSAWNASVRQAVFEQMMELAGRLDPQVALNMLDLIIDLSDIPGKDDFVARIREMNGHGDPDADPNDPEVQAEQQARAAAEEQKAQIEQMMVQLEMARVQSEIDKNNATAAATAAGMDYDRERLKIEKAKALHEIQTKDLPESKAAEVKQQSMTKSKDQVKPTERGEYGIKSDNKKKGTK